MSEPKGKRVRLLDFDEPVEATVIDLLSVQFTAEYNGYVQTYRFYKDEGDTWENG